MTAEPPFVPTMSRRLAAFGPLTTSALAAELGGPEAELGVHGDVVETADGWVSVVALAEGSVLTTSWAPPSWLAAGCSATAT